MKTVAFDTLSILPGVCLLAALAIQGLSGVLMRWVGGLVGFGVLGLGLWTATRAATAGGFGDQAAGGYVGARLVDRVSLPGASVGLTLEPLTTLLLVTVVVVGAFGVIGIAARGGGRGATGSALALMGLLLGELLLDGLTAVAVCFVLVGVVATLAPLSVLGARPAGAAALRAFALQRAGDGALVLGLAAIATSLGGLSGETLLVGPLDVDPWARVAGGLFDGQAHRTLWFIGGVGLAVAVASRLGVLCWPLLRDVTASPDLPPPLIGVVHAAWAGSAVVLLVRAQVIVSLAPEAADGFMWAAAASAVLTGVLACAGRDLLRVDVHLLSGAAVPLVVLSAIGSPGSTVLAGVVLWASALVLPWVMAEVVAVTRQRDPRALGGLEFVIPRLHTSRLLVTAGIGLMPPFAGWVVLERALESALLTPRVPAPLYALVVVGAIVVGAGAWRVLHLVFSGPRPEASSSLPPSSLLPVLPVMLVAFLVPGLALLELPLLLLRLLPFAIDYDGPLRTFVAPSVTDLTPALQLLRVPQVAPPIEPSTFIVCAVVVGLLPWAVSLLLWRRRGRGGQPPGAPLLGRPGALALADRLAGLAGRESPLARTVSEGAEALSRVLATNLIPVALGLMLQQIPGLAASAAGFVLRQLQSGGAQRALVVTCVAIALIVWLQQASG